MCLKFIFNIFMMIVLKFNDILFFLKSIENSSEVNLVLNFFLIIYLSLYQFLFLLTNLALINDKFI